MQTQDETLGLRLLRKGRKGILRIIFSRTGLISILLVINFMILFGVFFWLEDFLPHVYGGTALFTLGMVLMLFNAKMEPTAKLTWLALILLMPVFGCLLYLFTIRDLGHRAMVRQWQKVSKETASTLAQTETVTHALRAADPGAEAMARYVHSTGCFPVYSNTLVQYFPSGKEKYQALLKELKKPSVSSFWNISL